MYPNLYYAFRDLFNVNLPALRFVNSFGFFVALAFLAAAYILTLELRRKERAGRLNYQEVKIMVGESAKPLELILNFVLGFIFGYKIIGLFVSGGEATSDPQAYIFSGEGNLPIGILVGLLFAGLKWREKNKQKLAKPEERTIRIWPHDRVGDIVIFAAVFGFLGAKIFHNLENWEDFQANPIEALLSFSGLTFYGGLICAAAAIMYYARKHGIGWRHLADAMGPALILAYAIGRIGCQVAGDGDWGIPNSAYITTTTEGVQPADTTAFRNVLEGNAEYYKRQFQVSDISKIPHAPFQAPSWLPRWMVAYHYPNNVINEGTAIPGCTGQYCHQLPLPSYPTPFYETVFCLFLFGLLWFLRKRLQVPGTLFAVYLIVNGIERFLIEKIRVNTKYDLFGFAPTQAELISVTLVIIGIVLFAYCKKLHKTKPAMGVRG